MRFAVLLSLCTWVLAGSANADGLVQAIEVRCVEEAMYLSVTGKMISADYFWKDDASTRKLLANNGVYTLDRLSEEPVLCKIGSHLVKVTISINERQGATKCIDEIAGDLLVDVTDDRMAKVKLPSNCLDAGWGEVEVSQRWIKVKEFDGVAGSEIASTSVFKSLED